jgi:hypothetical protein
VVRSPDYVAGLLVAAKAARMRDVAPAGV